MNIPISNAKEPASFSWASGETIDVRDFIQKNYTPYEKNGNF